ncbi:hypothetical protein SCE1572_23465 [Sorangium cellulosum So0157-2]|uniref:Uncharacterized protein n=1 Tax=Sorangium cellulosum So0157-2 TaxID=1254432 RepID=S4XVC3_SORCE|nr:hypothetical protein SCE1572_23465 [Sorangium cellulosum So0157-2]
MNRARSGATEAVNRARSGQGAARPTGRVTDATDATDATDDSGGRRRRGDGRRTASPCSGPFAPRGAIA